MGRWVHVRFVLLGKIAKINELIEEPEAVFYLLGLYLLSKGCALCASSLLV